MASERRCHFVYLNEKENTLNQILNNIITLEEEISNTIVSYYIKMPIKINGRIVKMSLYELTHMIIHDYKNVVLKDFYNEIY